MDPPPEPTQGEAPPKLMDAPELHDNPLIRWKTDPEPESSGPVDPVPPADAAVDVADIGLPSPFNASDPDTNASGLGDPSASRPAARYPRPPMRKINFIRPPPTQHPPPPPIPSQPNATDSLSLNQLKRLVSDFPQVEPVAYDFSYEDSASFPEELEEWFAYTESEKSYIWRSRVAFEQQWDKFKLRETSPEPLWSWTAAPAAVRKKFVAELVHQAESADLKKRAKALGRLVYIASGVWRETAGLTSEDAPEFKAHGTAQDAFDKSTLQLKWIHEGVELIYDAMGIPIVYDSLRSALYRAVQTPSSQALPNGNDSSHSELEAMEQSFALTLMYLFTEVGRQQVAQGNPQKIRNEIVSLEPDLLGFLLKVVAKFRWNEDSGLATTKLILFIWKAMLLIFGDSERLDEVKKALSSVSPSGPDKPIITANPLDYHLFRQEITSKYPAYNPPPTLLPIEIENNSILPPLTTPSRSNSNASQANGPGPTRFAAAGNSILQQPVHITTPAPSPPPSPVGPGGKAGKKQNYQTNQNFPFLYPPLDASSNGAGGKGGSGLQEMLVGRKWEGSDIPASILEAGDLFATRTRMTRATRQLWEVRERYMKFERGWDSTAESKSGPNPTELAEIQERLKALGVNDVGDSTNHLPKALSPVIEKESSIPEQLQSRLKIVDDFYREGIPHFQSLVIVLLKEVLAVVTHLASQQSPWPPNGLGPSFQENGADANGSRPRPDPNRQRNGGIANGLFGSRPRGYTDVEPLDAARQREISSKAVSGCLITMLKWFKISHILKYEYLTQLLLDSNYLPLILKLFAHQDLDKAVESKADKPSLGFFAYCRMHSSQHAEETPNDPEESSDDEAVPPPIKLNRSDTQGPPLHNQSQDAAEDRRPPEVDELGHPTTAIPSTPIASFSWRNFFSSINFLKIMQKVVRHKTHRNLLLVHYKSSTILRKILKVPQQELRLYALKLFKGQVSYCGRKWRQSNMRVITAVYLHVPPELRDDWLAGGDIDSEVEEALPLEQALRALTHWWHCTHYPEHMGADEGLLESEVDFFARELDKMEWPYDDQPDDAGRDNWDGQPMADVW